MNILLLGSGGREHALAWKMRQSQLCDTLYIAPGNAGTHLEGENVQLALNDFEGIVAFCVDRAIDMLVVGPEQPLVDGIVDHIRGEKKLDNMVLVGPDRVGAQLEGSKSYAKTFMQEFGIPTAAYQEFDNATLQEGLAYIDKHDLPIVLKADGLAAGKGVLICEDRETAKAEFKNMIEGKFGEAGSTVVIEQFLSGIEFSVFVLTDGHSYKLLPVAKDYKRIGEGDTGLNTGGMGAVSPVPFVDNTLMSKVVSRIIEPTMGGLKKRGISYQGFIFFGLISVEGEPYVIEYNCRLGDPETEAILPRIKSDLAAEMSKIGTPAFNSEALDIDPQTCATVMLVSGGYPGSYERGKEISGMADVSQSRLFYAGAKQEGDRVITNGGRVMAISSLATTKEQALSISYTNADLIEFDKKTFRRDIGFDL